MIKTLMVSSIFTVWAFAAQAQSGQGIKPSNEANTTKSSAQSKTGFKPAFNPPSTEVKYNTPYYPRGTIATH